MAMTPRASFSAALLPDSPHHENHRRAAPRLPRRTGARLAAADLGECVGQYRSRGAGGRERFLHLPRFVRPVLAWAVALHAVATRAGAGRLAAEPRESESSPRHAAAAAARRAAARGGVLGLGRARRGVVWG